MLRFALVGIRKEPALFDLDTFPMLPTYEVIGPATDMRDIGIICRIKSTGRLLFITTYALEEENEEKKGQL